MAMTVANHNLAARLRDLMEAQHAVRAGEALGCRVVVLRRVPLASGVEVPVFGVPLEFLEAAQMLGLRAEGVQ